MSQGFSKTWQQRGKGEVAESLMTCTQNTSKGLQ